MKTQFKADITVKVICKDVTAFVILQECKVC